MIASGTKIVTVLTGKKIVQAHTRQKVISVMQHSNSTVASSRPRIFIARR